MVQRVFPGFDGVAPVVDELLSSPEGRRARLDTDRGPARRSAGRRRRRPPRPRPTTARDVAAVVQVLGSAAVWRALRDFWDLDGVQAATAVTTAIDALLTTTEAMKGAAMNLLAGVNHVAVLTADLDRFVEFYTDVSISTSSSKRPRRRSDTPSSARDRTRGSTPPRSGAAASPQHHRSCSNVATSTTSPSPRRRRKPSKRSAPAHATRGERRHDRRSRRLPQHLVPGPRRHARRSRPHPRRPPPGHPRPPPTATSNLTAVTLRTPTCPSERPARRALRTASAGGELPCADG